MYVGDYSITVINMVWENIEQEFKNEHVDGSAIMLWSTNNEIGFDFKIIGDNRRIPHELDGIKLMSFVPLGLYNKVT